MNAAKTGITIVVALAVGAIVYQLNETRKARAEHASAREQVANLRAELQLVRRYTADLEKEAAELTIEVRELRRKKEELSRDDKREPQETPAAYPLLAKINDQKLANVIVTVVMGGAVWDGFRRLFGLTDAEVERLNAALKNARAQNDAAIPPAQNVSVVNGRVIVALPAFSMGEDIREQLLNEFRVTLGEARYTALQSTHGVESIDRSFEGFGTSPRQITISRTTAMSKMPGAAEFTLMDTRRTPSGSSSSKMVRFSDVQSLPAQYAWLAPILPPLSDLPPPSGSIRLSPPEEKQPRP